MKTRTCREIRGAKQSKAKQSKAKQSRKHTANRGVVPQKKGNSPKDCESYHDAICPRSKRSNH